MATLEQLARAALSHEGLQLRSLAQDFLRLNPRLSEVASPATTDARVLATAAALAELFALRQKQAPPAWAQVVGGLAEPLYLVAAATRLKRLRQLCEAESPEPLRKRGLYAPPNFLEFV